MSIGIESFANANITITPRGVALGSFGTLAYVTYETPLRPYVNDDERYRSYKSLKELSVDWTSGSDAYKAAAAYYSQTAKDFVVIRAVAGVNWGDSAGQAMERGARFIALVLPSSDRDFLNAGHRWSRFVVAEWCEANKVIFMHVTENPESLLPDTSTSTDMASLCKKAGFRYTMLIYSSQTGEHANCAAFGRAANVNFEGIGSTITLNLKNIRNITPEDISISQLRNLKDKNCSAVVEIGKGDAALTDSKVSSGSWLDTTHGLMWLENKIEVDMFNFMYVNSDKIPYTQAGINMTKAVLQKSLESGIRNGFLAPGYLADGTFLSTGYRVYAEPLDNTSASDKSNRVYKGLRFSCTGSGALHELQVNGSFSE